MWCVEIQMEASTAFTMSAATMPLSLPLALAKKPVLNVPIMCVLLLISILFTNAFGVPQFFIYMIHPNRISIYISKY
jgi:hypothetical protein